MKHAGGFFLPDADTYFGPFLEKESGFQLDHLRGALAYVADFSRAIDGGAHVGTWTQVLAQRFAEVVAFEPAPDTFACLQQNCERYANVTCFPYALSARHEEWDIVESVTRQGNTGARYLTHGRGVKAVPIDFFHFSSVGFLKLDVEGFELFALEGAKETISRCRPLVLIEEKRFKDTEQRITLDHRAASRYLLTLGYVEKVRFKNDVVYQYGGAS